MAIIGTMNEGFARARERARRRKLLLEMNARLLMDIGISPGIAVAEAVKSWWRD